MARSARPAPSVLAGDDFTADEQAAFDAMQADAPAPEPAPEPDPAPEPEPHADAAADGEPAPRGDKADKPVPLGQLLDERKQRQATEKEFAEYRQRTEDRFAQILQRFTQPQPAQPAAPAAPAVPEIPDVTKDPIAHFQAKFDAQQREIERLTQGTRQSQQMTQAQQVDEAVRLTVQAQENKYRAEAATDYDDAVKYLQNSRREELEDLGFINPAEREMMIQQEAYALARRAVQNSKSFPEMIYNLAKRRGYATPAPTPPTPDPAPQADAEQRLERQAAGQQQARTLSNARGSAPQEMTAQRLATMNERDFDAWLSKATPEQQRAMFGA